MTKYSLRLSMHLAMSLFFSFLVMNKVAHNKDFNETAP